MNAPILFMPVGQDRAVADLAAAILEDGASASVVGPEGAGKTAVLDGLASELNYCQARVVRVACPAMGGLSLPAFLSQVVGRTKQGVLSDEDLELASDILTQTDAQCSQIVLLADDAHDLLPPALRYIQFACRSGPSLRVVLAGRPGTLELLRGDEFAFLRHRISRNIQLPPISASRVEPFATLDEAPFTPKFDAAPLLRPRRHGSAWALAGFGLAASIAFVLWPDRQETSPLIMPGAVAPESAPISNKPAIPAVIPTGTTVVEALPVAPEPAMPEIAAAASAVGIPLPAPSSAELVPAPTPVIPREVAVLPPQPAPEPPAAFVVIALPALEPIAAAALPTPELLPLVAEATPPMAAESVPVADLATLRAAAILQPQAEPTSAAVVQPDSPQAFVWADIDALRSAELLPASADITMAPLVAETAVAEAVREVEPSPPMPAIADAAFAQAALEADASAEGFVAVTHDPAVPSTVQVPTLATGPAASPGSESAVAEVAPAAPSPGSSMPAVTAQDLVGAPSERSAGTAGTSLTLAVPPVPPTPAPAPALAVIALPETPRRVVKPARPVPERVAAYDTRTDERRCRDIVLRAQLGEDITNADRQFLRGGCRAGR